jgi:hypothetical protein
MQPKRTWPMPTTVTALVLFAIVIPAGCLFSGLLASFSLAGGTPPTEEAHDTTRGLLIAGLISAVIAIGMALASAIAGRSAAVRVVAVIAILIGRLSGGVLGILLLSEPAGHVDSQPDTGEPVPPACGPESHPVVMGGDSRFTACEADRAAAQEFLETAVTELPIVDVTVSSVDAAASGIDPATYEGAHGFDNGDIVVAWYPAPVTCATALWRGGFWSLEVVGMLADGGCVYLGG